MAATDKKINSHANIMPQITLLFSQVFFLTVLLISFSFLLGAGFIAFERTLSPLYMTDSKLP
tara:strand:+ start:477 stop:662 length:186 start_codon:yes stop_codon:yes gene_type:complete